MTKRYETIVKAILFSLATSGTITLAALSPRVASSFFKYLRKQGKLEELDDRRKFLSALYRLKKSRLLIVSEKKGGNFKIELTHAGKRKVQEIQYETLQIPKPKKWDGVWRIVMFDIPKLKNKARDALRQKLKSLGFLQFQESAWVFPHPCNKEVEFLVELFRIYPFVQIIEATKIQNDLALKKHFKLF